MPSHCSVVICKSPQDASYFKFPSDPALCKRWERACRRLKPLNTKNARVCDRHFQPEDFVRDLKNELLNRSIKKKLKPGVAPTVNLRPNEKVRQESAKDKAAAARERKKIVEELLRDCKLTRSRTAQF